MVKPPREDLEPVQAFVHLERYNAVQLIQAVDADFIQLTKCADVPSFVMLLLTLSVGFSREPRC